MNKLIFYFLLYLSLVLVFVAGLLVGSQHLLPPHLNQIMAVLIVCCALLCAPRPQ